MKGISLGELLIKLNRPLVCSHLRRSKQIGARDNLGKILMYCRNCDEFYVIKDTKKARILYQY
jgi:hypothetical protein